MKKKIFSLFLVFFAFLLFAEAQRSPMRQRKMREPKTPEQRATAITNRLTKRLNLNGEQKQQIYKVNLQTAQRVDELRAEVKAKRERGEKPEKGFYAKQIRELNQQRDQSISATLNAQQKVEYEKLKQEQKERMRQRIEKRQKFRKKMNKQDTGFLENDDDFEDMLLDEAEDDI